MGTDLEKCANCGSEFSAMKHRANPSMVSELFSIKWPSTRIHQTSLVSCPSCGFKFSSNKVKYFGVLSYHQFQLLNFFLLACFAGVTIYLAVKSIWHA